MKAFQLPSLRVVTLDFRGPKPSPPRAPPAGAPLFDDLRALFASGAVHLREGALDSLALADFHALRAILTRDGWLFEEPVTFPCRNCEAPITHAPCAALALAPFADRELGDPELDATLPFDVAHAVTGLGDVRLRPLTAGDAAPLHEALARPRFRLRASLARAMGIASVGSEEDAARIARRLERASDAAFDAVTDLFLRAHYPPRLFSIAICPACGARNDVDAPYDREFEPSDSPALRARSNDEAFPSFDAFDARAQAIARERFAEAGIDDVALVVEGGVPACDDGGEPLLGAYLPGYAGDMTTPSRAPEITVYHRTFAAMFAEDGPYDWDAELDETIAHELEHHLADLEGDDPVDEEERREIAEEAARVVGKRELARREVRAMSADFLRFLRLTWPIWILLLLGTCALSLRS